MDVIKCDDLSENFQDRKGENDVPCGRITQCLKCFRTVGVLESRWKNILFGQAIAFVATSQNVISFTLESKMGIVFPMFLMFPAYVILSMYLFANRPEDGNTSEALYRVPLTCIKIRVPFIYYIGLSLLDVGPNYLILMALKHTSLTSVSLLGSLTIPSTMISCRILLNKRFQTHHFVGVLVCLSGGILTVLCDSSHHHDGANASPLSSHSNSFRGDILAIFAAVLYGFADAAGEYWAKHVDRKEYLGMIGFLGSLSTLVLFPLLERDVVYKAFSGPDLPYLTVILVLAYALFLAAYYATASAFMVTCDATLLNLSLQASNLWAIVFSIAAFQDSPPPLFFLAVVLVASGVCVYELCEKATATETDSKILPRTHSNANTTVYQSIPLS